MMRVCLISFAEFDYLMMGAKERSISWRTYGTTHFMRVVSHVYGLRFLLSVPPFVSDNERARFVKLDAYFRRAVGIDIQ